MRAFETYWQRNCTIAFLRSKAQFEHPSRILIAEETAKAGRTVLECGCATAVDYPHHVERGTNYTGIDITPKFVEGAKEYNPGIDVRIGTALALEFGDRSFDTVYCRALLEHMEPADRMDAVREMWRVADKLLIVCLYQSPRWEQPPREYRRSSANVIATRVNGIELRDTLKALPGIGGYEEKTTERVRKARTHWLFLARRI